MKIILGSLSPYRKLVLEEHGYEFETMGSEVDEDSIAVGDIKNRALSLARLKSEALQKKITEPAIVIASDTVVVCDGELLEKPKSKEEARKFLKKYSDGLPAEVLSALVVLNTKNGKRSELVDLATVFFHPMPDEFIERHIDEGDLLKKAGAFGIQHPSMKKYVQRIEGEEETVIGLPIHLLDILIKEVS